VAEWGSPSGDLVICLHGFPETSASWAGVAPALAEAGYHVLAPDQRGYSPGARPAGRRAYAMPELVADVVALAGRAGADRFHLVGHDWGGAVAWAVGAGHPDRLRTLAVLSTPHPEALRRSFARGTQLLRSWYIAFFQLPAIPERLILSGDVLRQTLERSGLRGPAVDTYVRKMREPGALTSALNWYRAVPFELAPPMPSVQVPTLYVWSTGDVALGREAAELTAEHVSGPYRFEVFDGVSHWIPEEVPDRLATLLLEHFRSGSAGG
jgi:pimeloyl-ACP methyl ester carboxylesterase